MPEGQIIVGSLSDHELAKVAREELYEDPSRVQQDISAIREWIKKEPHLHSYARTDDRHILGFLRGCKFSLERTKEKVDMFYSVRSACPEWFEDWNVKDPAVQDMINLGISLPLIGFDKHGRRVLLARGSQMEPGRHSLSDQVRFTFMVSEMLMDRLDQGSVTGVVNIQELKGMTLGHMVGFSPAVGKKMMTIWQDAYPFRPKGMHFMNMPSIMEGIFFLMKSFTKDKMKDRLMVHSKGDLSALHEAVGKEVLPAEYGGTNGTIQDHIDQLRKDMEEKSEWFKEQSKLKSNESKRRGRPKNHSDLFGMEGSFRQLAFD